MRGSCTRLERDDGFTILEVMIAAAILFVVLTGVLGLVIQSTSMGLQSKQNVVFNNVVNSYVERVQHMKFAKVVVGTGAGELPSSETTTVGEYTITITPSITPGAMSGLKTLTITAVLTSARGDSQTLTTDVVVRDKDRFLTEGANPPEIEWNIGMPAVDEVVWASQKASGGQLRVKATVKALDGKTLRSITIRGDGPVLEDVNGNLASWEWEAGSQPGQHTIDFWWNSAQTAPGETSGTVVPAIADGRRTLMLVAIDSVGAERASSYTMIVDNHPPGVPSARPVATVESAAKARLSWGSASDGTDPAWGYRVHARRQELGGAWASVFTDTVAGATAKTYDVAAFSRHWFEVGSIGLPPNSRDSASRAGMVSSWISPPRASGTATVVNNKGATVSLSVTQPQFPATGVSYAWQRAPTATGPWTQFATTRMASDTFDTKVGNDVIQRYYRCLVSFTPGTDYTGASAAAVTGFRSTVVGPTPTGTVTGQALPEQWVP